MEETERCNEAEAALRTRIDMLEQENTRLLAQLEQSRCAEQEHRVSEQIYRAIGESIPYGVWVCDPTGRNTYASKSLLDLLGITQEQCSEFGWGNSLHPDDESRTIAAWKECVRIEGVWDIEHRYRSPDGEYHPILARGVPVRDADGRIMAWAGINLDISRLKQAQEELRLSRERFELAIKDSPIVVFTQDRDLRYTWIYNPALGFTAAQAIGKTDEELRDPRDVMELVACKRSVLETGVGQRREFVMADPDGVPHTFDTTVEPLRDESGAIGGLTMVSVDITDVKRREQEAQENAIRVELGRRLLDQREQERLALARDVHDGPVQTLSSLNMEMHLARTAVGDPAARRELSRLRRHLKKALQELRELVGELRSSLPRRIGLTRAIRLYAHDFGAENSGLEVICRLTPDKGRLSEYASLALFRVLQEALSNIAKHAHASRVEVCLSFAERSALLEVHDDGLGMDKLPDAVEQTNRGHYGLAGMQERVDAVKGRLEMSSHPGQGTTVIATVPLEEGKQ